MPASTSRLAERQENAPGTSPGPDEGQSNPPNEVPDPRPSAPPPGDSSPPPDEDAPDPRPSPPPDEPDPQPDPEPQDPPPEPEPQDPPPNPDPRPSDPPAPDPEPEPQPSGETEDETTTRPPPPEPSSTTSDVSSTTDRPRPSSDDDDDETSSTSRRSEGGTSVAVDIITITSDGEIYTSTRTSTHFLPSDTATSLPVEPSSSSTNTGAIAGGVVGGVGALAILTVIAIFALKRYRRKQQEKEFDGNFDPVFVSRGSTSVSGLEAGSGGGGGPGLEEKASWRKSLGLRSGANRAVAEPDAPRVEDATLPRIDLDDEPPVPVNPFMTERDGSGIIGGIPAHTTGSSASSHVRSGSLPLAPYSATASAASFGVSEAPMGMGGHADSSGSSIHHIRALSMHSAGSSPLADVGMGSPPLPPPSAR